MDILSGLGKTSRVRLSSVLRETKGIVSVEETAKILQIKKIKAAKILSLLAKKGWLSRVQRGLYIPVPLESRTPNVVLKDPWLIVWKLFSPGYIGGWSSAEYWHLTEQIFHTTIVMTTKTPRKRRLNFKGIKFQIHTIPDKFLFGLKPVWRNQFKVFISDPTRTILDMLSNPILGGGIRPTADVFNQYLDSPDKNLELLIEYGDRMGNGAFFKRLGFFLEKFEPESNGTIKACQSRITKGNAKLDPTLKSKKLITRWRLWIPESWEKNRNFD